MQFIQKKEFFIFRQRVYWRNCSAFQSHTHLHMRQNEKHKKSSHSARKSGHSNQKRKKYTQKDAKESFDCWKLFIVFSSPPLRIYISMLGCYCIRIWNRRAKNAMQNNWGRVWRLVGIDKPPRLLRNAALNFYSLFTKCE